MFDLNLAQLLILLIHRIICPLQLQLLFELHLFFQIGFSFIPYFLDFSFLFVFDSRGVTRLTADSALLLYCWYLVLVHALPLFMSDPLRIVQLSQLAFVHKDCSVRKVVHVSFWKLAKLIKVHRFLHVLTVSLSMGQFVEFVVQTVVLFHFLPQDACLVLV
jgi:hypothetical protein